MLTNSTISNNTASEGGGIYSWSGELRVTHSTISHNISSQGGGIYTWGDPINLKNTIVAQNSSDLGCHGGEFNFYGYNLIEEPGDPSDPFGCTINEVENPSTNITGQQPLLRALADNGGPTETHALLDGSPAIDAGSCTDIDGNTVSTDQRGESRAQGAICDIGSFELSAMSPTPIITPSPTLQAGGWQLYLPAITR